jgi:hypothetical protein
VKELLALLTALRPGMSARQLRWFGCSCARLAWGLLTPADREALTLGEHLAAGQSVWGDLSHALAALTGRSDLKGAIARAFGWNAGPYDTCGVEGRLRECAHAVAGALASEAARGLPPEAPWEEARDRAHASATRVLCELLLDVGHPGPPSRPRDWPMDVVALAAACQEGEQAFPILADALDDLGEAEAAAHCRRPLHSRGCHVVERVLGHDLEPPLAVPLALLAVSQPWAELVLRGTCEVVIQDQPPRAAVARLTRAYLFAAEETPGAQREQKAAGERHGLALASLPTGLIVGQVTVVRVRPLRREDERRAGQSIRHRTAGHFAWEVTGPRRFRVPFKRPVAPKHLFRML